jgi:hypothetical protein
MMELAQRYPAVIAAVVVVALGLAGWSVWRTFAPPRSSPTASPMGEIRPRSSILGPSQSGAPRTAPRPGERGPGAPAAPGR